jgi:hypothetical protein
MTHEIIDYLSEQDRNELAYKAVQKDIDSLNPTQCANSDELLTVLNNLNTDNDSLILTILTHGHVRGITFGTYASLISWCELCKNANSIRTTHPLTLNLITICNSDLIIPYKKDLGTKIDKIWVSTDSVLSINKGLLVAKESSFKNFFYKLEEEEKGLYKEFQ